MYNTQERLHNRLFYHLFMKFLSVTLICFPFPPPLPHFSMYHSQLWGKKDSRNKNVFNNSGPHLALPNFVFQVLPTGHSLQLYWCADSQIFLSVFLSLFLCPWISMWNATSYLLHVANSSHKAKLSYYTLCIESFKPDMTPGHTFICL